MRPTDPKVIARSYFEELINKHNLSFADQLFDSAIALYDPAIIPGGQAQGLNAVKQFFFFGDQDAGAGRQPSYT